MTRKPRPIRIDGDVAYVPLTKGYEAVIDAADVPLVEGIFWHSAIQKRRDGTIKAIYARRRIRLPRGEFGTMPLHRVICGAPDGVLVDHVDTDGLNNRRKNIRQVTFQQNGMNRRGKRNSVSQVKGVCWKGDRKKWRARITLNGKEIHLGFFERLEDAAQAYAIASGSMHGEFGRVS